jgi:aminopeptidase YwaD
VVAAAEQALEASPVSAISPVRHLSATLVVLALACALLIAGCGGNGDDPSTSPSPSPPTTRTRTASPSPSPTPGLGSAEFESARALAIARTLAVDIGIRAAGTDGEKRAAGYLRDELSNYGYEASLQPFPVESFVDVNSSVEVQSSQSQIDASALAGSENGSVQANLVVAGLGHPQEFPAGTAGSVVLIERGQITFSEKVSNATVAGAAGVIIYNNEEGGFFGQLQEKSRIPAATVSREDGETLLDAVNSGAATVKLTVEGRTETAESNNVIGRPPGGQCRIVIGGHYDSVPAGPGANDNASGTSVVVEMARAMAADGVFDDTCFVLFGSEEIGLLGSAHYVSSLQPGEQDAIEAMLNFDMLGVGDTWPFGGSPSVLDVVAQQAERLSLDYSLEGGQPENAGSDHASFINAGIPSVIFNCFCDDTWHTAADTFDRINEQRLADAGALGMGTARALLGT